MFKNDVMALYTQRNIYILFYFLFNQVVIKIFWYDSNLFINNYNLNIAISL